MTHPHNISQVELETLQKIAHHLDYGDLSESEILGFLREVHRMGYLARKVETHRTALAVEKLKGVLNG
jgi:hypothetical protein